MAAPLGIVWFKRDLRLNDHAALEAAENSGLALSYIWIIEPEEWSAPENALRHWQFQWASIQQLNEQELEELQNTKLQRILNHAAQHIPHYQSLNTINQLTLKDFPILHKHEIKKNIDDLINMFLCFQGN
jgi:deoxyribodipyrimidine photolyase